MSYDETSPDADTRAELLAERKLARKRLHAPVDPRDPEFLDMPEDGEVSA